MASQASSRAVTRGWAPVTSSDGVVAIHAALVLTDSGEGEIILFGGNNHSIDEARAGHFNHTRRFNCLHPELPLIHVQSPTFDVFCCGHAFLSDGRLLVAGGTLKFPADAGGIHHHAMHFEGHRRCAIYTPTTGTFSVASDPNPRIATGHGREMAIGVRLTWDNPAYHGLIITGGRTPIG